MNRVQLASAERVAHSLAWAVYESEQNNQDAIDKMIIDKIDEISNDAGEMSNALIWFADQSHANAELVEQACHALDIAARGKSNEAILEAAIGIADLRDRAARERATFLVERMHD